MSFLSKDARKIENITETIIVILCATNYIWLEIYGFLSILVAILCFANLKVKVTRYRMLSDRFDFSTHQLCKNIWITNYTPKSRAKLHVSEFSLALGNMYDIHKYKNTCF